MYLASDTLNTEVWIRNAYEKQNGIQNRRHIVFGPFEHGTSPSILKWQSKLDLLLTIQNPNILHVRVHTVFENNQKQFLNYFSSSFLVFLTHKHELATKVNNGDSAKNSKFLSSHPVHVDLSDDNIANKIYLVSKDIPLLIKKSNFAKNSACHAEKIAKLRSQ